MDADSPREIITISPERLLSLIQEHLRQAGIQQPICGIQICVDSPFGVDMKVHNEVPRLNVILSNAPASR